MNKIKNIKPQTAFLIIGLIYGIGFLLITPPFQVPDESTHFYKEFYLSEGHIIPVKLENEAGVYVPESVLNTVNTFEYLPFHPENKLKIEEVYPLVNLPLNESTKAFIDISGTSIVTYSPIPYLIPTVAIVLGKLFNLSPLALLYIGRFANLLTWIFLTYFAIKITPVHKWVFLMLALLPMTIFQGASLSADSLIFGLSFIITAIFLKFAFDDNKKTINVKDIFLLFFLIVLLALSKSVYLLLILLFFIIPVNKFQSRKKMLLIFGSMFLPILAIVGIWNFFVNGLYVPISPLSAQNQISFILSNPFQYILIFYNTLIINHSFYLTSFIGNMGWLDTPLPNWLVNACILLLIGVSLVDKNKTNINLKHKSVIFITLLSIFTLIFTLTYLTWPSAGQNIIDGVQGRYLIPIAPLLFLLFYNTYNIKINNRKINFCFKHLNLVMIIFIIISLSIALITLTKRFY